MASQLLTARQVGDWIGVSEGLLADWRYRSRSTGRPVGPPFTVLGDRLVRYDEADVQGWLDEHRHEFAVG